MLIKKMCSLGSHFVLHSFENHIELLCLDFHLFLNLQYIAKRIYLNQFFYSIAVGFKRQLLTTGGERVY